MSAVPRAMLVMALVCRGHWPVMGYAFAYQPVFMDRRYFRGDLHCHGHFHDPKLGATTVLALMVVGQMLLSLMLDHYGLLGIPVYPVTGIRLLGVVLLVLGVVLIRWQA
ncbi:DMT family transporter [Klebsiella pneumoniae]|uniref:DMT family transporter n=1 Tax=Klebsiella pneumoniae TaxID=573 RepID=UPI00388F965D